MSGHDFEQMATSQSGHAWVKAEGRRQHNGVPRENLLRLLPNAVAPKKDELGAIMGRVRPLNSRQNRSGIDRLLAQSKWQAS